MASNAAQLTTGLFTKMRNSAKKLLVKEEAIREAAKKATKNADELKHVDEMVNELRRMLNKTPEQMWKEFEYKHLMEIPPSKKPCFLAGTLVKTENGHLPIEQIKAGDKVFTYNLEKKQTEINTVTRVYENVTQKYLKINTQNSSIEATGQHRFWIPKQEKWLMANELKTGMYFIDSKQNLVEIRDLQIIESEEKTYNLEIENNHNYFVGQDEILTHNTNKVFKFSDETLYDFGFY
ncbi:MAG: Hint domain-containing protein, partial [Flavobacterium sp.]